MSDNDEELLEKVEKLKSMLTSHAEKNWMSDSDYRPLRRELLSNPDVASHLPEFVRNCRTAAEFWSFIIEYSQPREFLRRQFDPLLTILEQKVFASGAAQSEQMFFRAGQEHNAFVQIRDLVKTAKVHITIVDSYVDDTLWSLLGNVDGSAEIRILSSHMKGDFTIEGKKFAAQHGNTVQIRQTSNYHDRFIVADDRCWHLGASIKDAGAKDTLNKGSC